MTDPLCRLHVTSRESVGLAPGLVEAGADMLGLPAAERIRLSALMQEVLDAVLADAFGTEDDVDLEIEIGQEAGDMTVLLHDRGAPLDFGSGYPPRVAELIRLGFADGLTFASAGREGNRTQITKRLPRDTVQDDQQFIAQTEAEPPEEPTLGEDGQAVVDVRPMTADDVVGVARLFYRCYGYTVSYAPVVYEPQRLAEMVTDGRHVGTVAVSPQGQIVGHLASELEDPAAKTGKIGLLAVDPRYRRFGVSLKVGFAHLSSLVERGFIGQYAEAVTVHTRSQQVALTGGAHEVGLQLAGQSSELDFRGFDTDDHVRKALMLFYGAIAATPARESHVPPIYREVVERIYAKGKLPRTVHADFTRDPSVGSTSRLRLELVHGSGVATVHVEAYAADFVQRLQEQVAQLRLNQFALILVMLPLSDPATSHYGSGLQEIGLSFSGVYPESADGDVLILQTLNNVEIRPDEINVASDLGTYLRDFVLKDFQHASERVARRERSRATMARIYEALD